MLLMLLFIGVLVGGRGQFIQAVGGLGEQLKPQS